MKRFVVVVVIVLAVFWQFGFAQMKDAQYMIGGGVSVSFNTYEITAFRSTGFYASLYPSLGVFVTDRLVLGGQISASYSSSLVGWYGSSSYPSNNGSFGLAPMARYFWSDLANQFVGFSQLSCGGNYSMGQTLLSNGGTIPFQEFRFQATAATGVSWFVVPNVGIEAALQYTYATSIPVNLQLVVGVQAYINRK